MTEIYSLILIILIDYYLKPHLNYLLHIQFLFQEKLKFYYNMIPIFLILFNFQNIVLFFVKIYQILLIIFILKIIIFIKIHFIHSFLFYKHI